MKFRRGFCIECGDKAIHKELSYLCEECLDKKIKSSVKDEIFNRDRKVESPHSSWF